MRNIAVALILVILVGMLANSYTASRLSRPGGMSRRKNCKSDKSNEEVLCEYLRCPPGTCRLFNGVPKCVSETDGQEFCPKAYSWALWIKQVCTIDGKLHDPEYLALRTCEENKPVTIQLICDGDIECKEKCHPRA